MDFEPGRQPAGSDSPQNPTKYQNIPSISPNSKRSTAMMTASIIFSTIAISMVCCIYISFVCGALGILFALLSKGGEMTMASASKVALVMSVSAMVLTVLLTGAAFWITIQQYGSFDSFYKAYQETINTYLEAGGGF